MERTKHFFSILRAGILSLTAFTMLFASCGLKDDVDQLQKDVDNINKEITDLKSALEKVTAAGKLVTTISGDGTATDIVMNFSDGTKLVIPKNTAASTITTTVEETPSYVKVTITTTSNGVSTPESFTINKPVAAIGSFEIVTQVTVASTPVVVGVPNYAVKVRVNPSNALFVAENLKLATKTYASAIVASDVITVHSIKSVATGVYEVGIAALESGDTITSTQLADMRLAYIAPNAAGDPIETVSLDGIGDGTGTIVTSAFKAITEDNVATNIVCNTTSTEAYTSKTTFIETAGFTKAAIKSVTYSLDEDGAAFGTVTASPDDMTKFVFTPKAAAFGKDQVLITDAEEIIVYAVYEDIKGNKAQSGDFGPLEVGVVKVVTAFSDVTVTLPAQTLVLPNNATQAKDDKIEIELTNANYYDMIPAGFDLTVAAAVLKEATIAVSKAGKAPADGSLDLTEQIQFDTITSGASTLKVSTITGNKLVLTPGFNQVEGAKTGTYQVFYTLTDNRTDYLQNAKGKKFTVVIPVTFTAPGFTAEMIPVANFPLGAAENFGITFVDGKFTAYYPFEDEFNINADLIAEGLKAGGILCTTGKKPASAIATTNLARVYDFAADAPGKIKSGLTMDSVQYVFKSKYTNPVEKGDRLFGMTANPMIKVALLNGESFTAPIIDKAKNVLVAAGARMAVQINKLNVASVTPTAVSKGWSKFNTAVPADGKIEIYKNVAIKLASGKVYPLDGTALDGNQNSGTVAAINKVTYEVVVDGSSVSVATIKDKYLGVLTTAATINDVLDKDVIINVKVTVEDVWNVKTIAIVPVTLKKDN